MQVLYERCAAVDAGKDVIAVAVRLPGGGRDGRQTGKRMFKTFYGVLADGEELRAPSVIVVSLVEGRDQRPLWQRHARDSQRNRGKISRTGEPVGRHG